MRVTEYFAHADGRFLATRGFLKQRIGQIRGALTQQQNNGRAPVEKHSLLGTAMNPRFCIVVQNFADQQGADFNLFKADAAATANLARLPETLRSACQAAADSAFIRAHLPQAIRDIYCNR